MEHPQYLYFIALTVIVIPLLPFSRSAFVVGAAWLPGQFAYLIGANPAYLDMCVAIIACGAGMAVANNDRDKMVAMSYLASAAVAFSSITKSSDAYSLWWLDWYWAMARILVVPTTINFTELRNVYRAFKERKEWNREIWGRVTCWRFG